MRIQCPNCQHGLEIVPDAPSKEVRCPSCGSQLDLSSTTETVTYRADSRRTIGHFELLEQVGRGHFGNVWRARDTELKRIVAVKIPRTSDLSPADKEMFLREAQTAAKLRHPNIVTVYEVGREGDAIFIVSDFIPGITLAEQIQVRPPTFQQAALWCATVADALDYAHENGVIHRDMKPGNVMLEKDKPYVLDFGLAKHEASDFTITTEGEILGTPAYMSPEQARGQSGSADRRSDVYSLGTILYEMLTGRRPFQGGSRALMHQILNDEPTSPRKIKKEIPRDLETICLRALSKEPNRRYVTAKEMADDLRHYLAGEPIHARPVRWPERSWRWIRRNSALSIASGIAAMAIIGLVAIGIWGWLSDGKQLARMQILQRELTDPKSTTSPAKKSTCVFWRLDPETGETLLDSPVRVDGADEIAARLLPGDYLVVVQIPNHGFHEVYRHIPSHQEPLKGAYNHQFFEPLADGAVRLNAVKVPPDAVADGMTSVPGGSFEIQNEQRLSPDRRETPTFLIDTTEVSIEEYQEKWGRAPQVIREKPERIQNPVHHVNWWEAMAYAEKIGKRLPEQVEFEAALATQKRSRILALTTGVSEWMRTWGNLPRSSPISNPEAKLQRLVLDNVRKETKPSLHYPKDQLPNLGFRCARSVKPRLDSDDFSIADAK